MFFSKYTNKEEDYTVSVILGIIFGAITGVVASGIGLAIPSHISGIVMAILVGFFIGVILEIENHTHSLIVFLTAPLTSLAVFEIIFEINMPSRIYPVWVYGVIILVITEILFLLDKTQPNTIDKDKVMGFTAERKIEAFIETIIILSIAKAVHRQIPLIDFSKIYPVLLDIFMYILGIISIILIIYGFIWINSFRYKKI